MVTSFIAEQGNKPVAHPATGRRRDAPALRATRADHVACLEFFAVKTTIIKDDSFRTLSIARCDRVKLDMGLARHAFRCPTSGSIALTRLYPHLLGQVV